MYWSWLRMVKMPTLWGDYLFILQHETCALVMPVILNGRSVARTGSLHGWELWDYLDKVLRDMKVKVEVQVCVLWYLHSPRRKKHYTSASVYEIRGFHFIWSDIKFLLSKKFLFMILITRNGTHIRTASVTL